MSDSNGKYQNSIIVGERRVVLKNLEVKERPDQAMAMVERGKNTVPVYVVAELLVDGEEAWWPTFEAYGDVGMWFDSMEDWEREEDAFRATLASVMEDIAYKREEKKDNITGF